MLEDNLVYQIDGEEIFRAIYFFEGSATTLIPSIDVDFFSKISETFDRQNSNEFEYFKNSIVQRIREFNPDFFNSFEQEMTSGNHSRIKTALDKSLFEYEKSFLSLNKYADVMNDLPFIDLKYEKFIDKNGDFDSQALINKVEKILLENGVDFESKFSNSNQGTCLVLGVVVVVYFGAAVAAAVGVIGGIYLYLAAGQYTAFYKGEDTPPQAKRNQDQLHIEMFINDIAIGLNREGLKF